MSPLGNIESLAFMFKERNNKMPTKITLYSELEAFINKNRAEFMDKTLDALMDMNDLEFSKIPTILFAQNNVDFLNNYAIIFQIDRSGETAKVYSLGGNLFKIEINKQNDIRINRNTTL